MVVNGSKKYFDMLDDGDKAKVVTEASQKSFTFGNGVSIASLKRVNLPCYIGNSRCNITTDVIDCNIPLLMSKNSMKKANMIINLGKDSVSVSGKNIELACTSSGHYIMKLTR